MTTTAPLDEAPVCFLPNLSQHEEEDAMEDWYPPGDEGERKKQVANLRKKTITLKDLINASRSSRENASSQSLPPTLATKIKVRPPPPRRPPGQQTHHHMVIEDPVMRLERARMGYSGVRGVVDAGGFHESRVEKRDPVSGVLDDLMETSVKAEGHNADAGSGKTFRARLVDFLVWVDNLVHMHEMRIAS
ncbi:uncharacterized protein SPPG_09581 [Spizellomyces punctatus DAOM BR117]|uniref:Uncharacterized protein n=1 Tax=Spizellomyces punctatus (strain DAOM BR117) TaxID=645134 RepID=A0A0L0H4A0_SPIPD|nr:uncharacterized protein SPPG_09581 [Spizellomyces punctatus DAOM BR117]KNC95799.1 hypothetical protein SPPG_09581 [Spizellomyces punctatus DAOM BR117]|eukprot:XP_016603839.1 hypothetical protein SPPG_09581 [Spizellomyces punctatus DAOM BR117]